MLIRVVQASMVELKESAIKMRKVMSEFQINEYL